MSKNSRRGKPKVYSGTKRQMTEKKDNISTMCCRKNEKNMNRIVNAAVLVIVDIT